MFALRRWNIKISKILVGSWRFEGRLLIPCKYNNLGMALINRNILAHQNGIFFVLVLNNHTENCRLQNYKPHTVLCGKLDGFTEPCTTVHLMACWEWKTIEPRVSQSSLPVTSVRKRLQIEWLQGALCLAGVVSQGQKLPRNKSLFVLAAASSCSTPLVGNENDTGWRETHDHQASEVTSRSGIWWV